MNKEQAKELAVKFFQNGVRLGAAGMFLVGASRVDASAPVRILPGRGEDPVLVTKDQYGPEKYDSLLQQEPTQPNDGVEVALAVTVNGLKVPPSLIEATGFNELTDVLAEMKSRFDIQDGEPIFIVTWNEVPTGGKLLFQVGSGPFEYVVFTPASEESERSFQVFDGDDIDAAKVAALETGERKSMTINGVEYKNPKNGVIEIENPKPFETQFAVGGFITNTDEVNTQLTNASGEKIEVTLQRVWMTIPLEDGNVIKVRWNSIQPKDVDPDKEETGYAISSDGVSNSIPVTWEKLLTHIRTSEQVFALSMNYLSSDEFRKLYVKSVGSCDDYCERITAILDTYSQITENVLRAIATDTYMPESFKLSADGYIDVGSIARFILSPKH